MAAEAVESTTAAPVPAASRSKLLPLLAAAPARLDGFLCQLHRCMQSRAGTDVVLLFVCYACRLGGSLLEVVSRSLIQRSARRLVALALRLPPHVTVVLSSALEQDSVAAFSLRLAERLKAISALLSEARTIGRLWGLLGLYLSAKKLLAKASAAKLRAQEGEKTVRVGEEKPRDRVDPLVDAIVAYAQITALVVFQASENVAYLSKRKIIPCSAATQARLSLLSVRSWGLYIGMELGRLLVERSRKMNGHNGAESAQKKAWTAEWKKDFLRNLAWAPLTMHWGTRQGLLPDLFVSLLAIFPSTGLMMDLWRENGQGVKN